MEEWEKLATATARRYAKECDSWWHAEAERLAKSALASSQADQLGEADWRSMLSVASRFPSDGASSRSWLWRLGKQRDFPFGEVDAGVFVCSSSGALGVVLGKSSSRRGHAVGALVLEDERQNATGDCWLVLGTSGHVDVVPESLLCTCGRPSEEVLWSMVEVSSGPSIRKLAELFPELLESARRKR